MSVARSLLYAAANVLHPRMLRLMLWPMLLALGLWGSIALVLWTRLALRIAVWLQQGLDYALAWTHLDLGAAALVAARVDALAIDSAHGHSSRVLEAVAQVKKRFPQIDLMAGNIATYEGAIALIDAGADAIKVGIGPGSICTTRMVTGAGMPQITAIFDCAEAADRHGIPICADGGIQHSGDIAKAIGAGAWTVMLGGLLAGVDESPGDVVETDDGSFKSYRGMGSLGAMEARRSRDRYGQADVGEFSKVVPEGVEGRVRALGPLAAVIHQLVGGLRAGMGYAGASTIDDLRTNARFVRISGAGLRESHPHDIRITAEAPNYRVRA